MIFGAAFHKRTGDHIIDTHNSLCKLPEAYVTYMTEIVLHKFCMLRMVSMERLTILSQVLCKM